MPLLPVMLREVLLLEVLLRMLLRMLLPMLFPMPLLPVKRDRGISDFGVELSLKTGCFDSVCATRIGIPAEKRHSLYHKNIPAEKGHFPGLPITLPQKK